MARGLTSRRDAWFRVIALFTLDLLFLGAGLLALRGDFEALAAVIVVGATLAIGFNLFLLWRIRTTEVTWRPGSGSAVLRTALEFLGIRPGFIVRVWEVLGAAGIVVNLVALVTL